MPAANHPDSFNSAVQDPGGFHRIQRIQTDSSTLSTAGRFIPRFRSWAQPDLPRTGPVDSGVCSNRSHCFADDREACFTWDKKAIRLSMTIQQPES
ncbi:hypothetical protein G6F57_015152 [Rhizopus arrhizus]|nr:hypothetical protein G6F57_015152 [Rhizopus arrhizus]